MNLLIVRRNQNVLNISRIGYKHILKVNDYITNFQMFVLNNMSEKNLYNKKKSNTTTDFSRSNKFKIFEITKKNYCILKFNCKL